MDPFLREIADLVVRWVHLIAGIMWVGNSMLFNWLDRSLEKKAGQSPKSFGDIWLLHSGAYYYVEKKMLAPSEFPEVLHWFKWQAYTTWISGAALLFIVYYMGGSGSFLVDPNVRAVSADFAMDFGLGVILGGFALYNVIWFTLGKRAEGLATFLTGALVLSAIVFVPRVLAGRAAFLHVGAMLGTMMAGNVFTHIVPSQRALVAATKKGESTDLALSAHAKQRSIHNNYFTFPLLFIMVSNHFPGTYGGRYPSLTLGLLIVTGALVRHFMNSRWTFKAWLPSLLATVTVSLGLLIALVRLPPAAAGAPVKVEKIPFSSAQMVIRERCVPCHSQTPKDETLQAPPNGIMFDTPDQIKQHAERIKVRAVVSRTMPLGNKTQMTEEERGLLAKWVMAGAPTTD